MAGPENPCSGYVVQLCVQSVVPEVPTALHAGLAPAPVTTEDAEMAADTVCQACALCCDGTLFTRVPLAADDVAPREVHAVTTPAGGRYLPQPCAALEGTRCTVYAQRPTACRRFECLLLAALRDGEVTEAGALELVAKARALGSAGERERRLAHLAMYFQRR